MNTLEVNYSNGKGVIEFRYCIEILFILIILTALTYTTNTTYASSTLEIESSLRISGTETREYTNQNIVIKGDISVDENASLRFQNCNITILWVTDTERHHIEISDSSNLLLENSSLMLRLDQIPNYSTNGRIVARAHTRQWNA